MSTASQLISLTHI